MKKVYDVNFKDIAGKIYTVRSFNNMVDANKFVRSDKLRSYKIVERIM